MANKLIYILLTSFLVSCTGETTRDSDNSEVTTPVEKTKPKNDKKNIVFFGNSLTAGYGLDISESFPAQIQIIIDSLELGYTVINAGLSGETTSSGNSRIDWVLKNEIDVFVLELGANDGLRGIPTSETRKNLQEIINKVRAKYPDAKVVLAGMQVPPNMGQDYSSDFQSIFPEIAEKNNAPLIPFLLQDVAGEPDLNLEDGIHPTAYGHQIVAINVWKILRTVL